MKKFLSLVLALVMAMSLTTVAWADDPVVAKIGDTGYATLQEAINNADGKTVVMLDNVTDTTALRIPENTNVTLDMNGKTFTSMDGGTATSWMAVDIRDGATLTLTGNGKIVASCYGVYVQPDATFNLVSGSIEVSGNGTYDMAVVVWNGTFNMGGGSVKGLSGVTTYDHSRGTSASTVSITAGSVEGTTYGALELYGDYDVEVSGGVFEGGIYIDSSASADSDITISGGTFSGDVTAYLAEGLDQTEDGVVVSEGGAALEVTYDIETTDISKTKTVGVTVNTYKAKAPKDTSSPKDGLLDQPGNVKYVEFSNMLGRYFVQVNRVNDADYTVYQTGTETLFGYFKEIVSPFYLGDGVAFYDFGEKCGQYDDVPTVGAKYYLFQGNVYMADATYTSATNLMVGTTLTPVTKLDDEWVDHVPAFTYDKDYKIVAVKCSECGTPGVIVANYKSLPKAILAQGEGVGFFPVNGTEYYYWLAGPVADTDTDTETTDKTVTSAETFDAGIAMYVGMSVLAATGSAVVIGKKKD